MSERFTYYDLGHRSSGEIVEITLSGSAANVRLMDSSNYQNFKNGQQHRYIGGLAKRSPVRLQIPHSGHWYVTVDLQGLQGSVRSSMRILPSRLPELREVPLSSIPSLVRNIEEEMPEAPTASNPRAFSEVTQTRPVNRPVALLVSRTMSTKIRL